MSRHAVTAFARNSFKFFLVLTICAVLSCAAFGQSATGRIQGTVTDSSGAVVSGADVTVTSVDTARQVTAKTGGAGEFSITALNPGRYTVEVKAPNFKTATQNITLQVSQVLPLTIALETGAVTESVQVTAAPPMVESASSNLGEVVVGPQVTELPLNGRNFTQLATLVPGVTRGVPNSDAGGQNGNSETYRYNDTGGAALVVNGLRPQANNFLLDGFDNNESLVNTIIFFPPAEAVQEFRVDTSVAPAEYGRAGGAVVDTSIRSGTNQIHGTAFEFFRNSALDARPFFDTTKPQFHRNLFGGSLGAPIIKNKLFIFGDYQGLRSSAPLGSQQVTVPTQLMRSSNFTNFSELLPGTPIINPLTGTAFPNNIITIPLNQAAVNYLNAFPAPNCNPSVLAACGNIEHNYNLTRNQVEDFNDFDIRADWVIGAKDTMFGRFSYANDSLVTSSEFTNLPAGFGSGSNPTHPWSPVLEETHLFSPTLINEARVGFIHTSYGYTPPLQNIPVSYNLGIQNANTNAAGQLDPELGGGALIGGNGSQLEYTGDYGPYLVPQNTWQFTDNLSWVKGKHTLKFGADVIRRQVDFFRPLTGKGFFNLFGDGGGLSPTHYEITDLLVGFVNNYQVGPVLGNSETRNWETGYYAQDDWRVNQRLTLNLGFRWDVMTWPVEKYDRQANFDIFSGALQVAGQNGNSRSFIGTDWHNFAPRIGFAYDLTGDGKTKVSAGYGIFYFMDRGGISNQLAQNPPFSGQTNYSYVNGYRISFTGQAPLFSNDPSLATGALPSKGPIQVDLNNPANVGISVATLDSNVPASVQQWNFTFQRELGPNTAMTMSYVGTKGTHLMTYFNYNRQYYDSPSNTVNYPALGGINVQDAIGTSNYNALQTQLNRRMSNGLLFGINYTWSHTIDDSPGAFDQGQAGVVDYRNLGAERANSLLDVRNRFVMNMMYELPFGRGHNMGSNWNGFTNAVLGGWNVNFIATVESGTPFDLIDNQSNPNVRPDLVGDPYATNGSELQSFNPAAFGLVPTNGQGVAISAGTTPRNILTGPAYRDVDFSTFKDFKMGERFTTQFRAEFFNLLNTAQFAQPDQSITDSNFGQITSIRYQSERQIQFALRISF